MEQRLASEKADIADIALMQNVQRAPEPVGGNPAQVGPRDLAQGEIAEIALGIARVGHRYIADRRTPTANQPQHVKAFGRNCRHGVSPKRELYQAAVMLTAGFPVAFPVRAVPPLPGPSL